MSAACCAPEQTMTSLAVGSAAATLQKLGELRAKVAVAGRRPILHQLGGIVEQRSMKGARKVVQRKRLGRGVSGCQIDRARFGRVRQPLHNAFEPRAARQPPDIGLPAARKRFVAIGRRRHERAFPRSRNRATAGRQQFVGLRDRHQRAIERTRKVAHRGKTISLADAFRFDRVDEPIGELHVERTRIAWIELQRFCEAFRAIRRLR